MYRVNGWPIGHPFLFKKHVKNHNENWSFTLIEYDCE